MAETRHRPSKFCRERVEASLKIPPILSPECIEREHAIEHSKAEGEATFFAGFCGRAAAELRDMKFVLTTHNVKLTQAIEDHILGRIEKLEHFDRWAVDARVNLEHDQTKSPEKQFKCSMRLGVRGPDLFAEDSESDLYAAIDLVTKKIERQIRKRHSKRKAKRTSQATKQNRQAQEN